MVETEEIINKTALQTVKKEKGRFTIFGGPFFIYFLTCIIIECLSPKFTLNYDGKGYLMKKLALLLTIALFATIGCDKLMKDETILVDDPELQAFSDGLNTDIGLSNSSINALNGALNRHGKDGKHRRDPAFLWNMAVEMQKKLSDKEKTRLLEWMDKNAVPYLFSSGMDGGKGRGGPHGDKGEFDLRGVYRVLSDDQKASFKTIMTTYGEKMKTIQQQVKDGTIDKEVAKTELEALSAAMNDEVEALLTDEQKQQLADEKSQMEARMAEMKKAAHDAMVNALGMSNDQESGLETINKDAAAITKALFEKARNEKMDRETLHNALKSIISDRNTAIDGLFDDTQIEIIKLYTAMGMQYKRHCGQKGREGGKGNKG